MKKLMRVIVLLLLSSMALTMFGCYGSFTLTQKLYKWNGTVGNKFANSAVFWVFVILPVYDVTLFIDGVVLNTIEFWLEENPLALADEEIKVKIVKTEDKVFEITAGNNSLKIKVIEGSEQGKEIVLQFDQLNNCWYLCNGTEFTKLAELDRSRQDIIRLFYPDGEIKQEMLKN